MFALHGSRSGGSDQIRGIIIIFHIHGVRRRQEIIRDYENCVVSKEENLRRKNAQPFCCEKVFHTCQLIKIPPLLDILIFLFFVVSCRECEPSSSAVSCYITPTQRNSNCLRLCESTLNLLNSIQFYYSVFRFATLRN